MNIRHGFVLPVLVAGLSASWAQAPQTKAAAPPAQPPAQQQEERPRGPVPPGYKYQPSGRRDPFVNPVPKRDPEAEQKAAIPVVRPPGLKGVLINELTIAGIVTSREPGMNVAAVLAPGNRTFWAFPGDELLDGLVKEIRSDSVVFTIRPLPGAPPNPAAPKEVTVKIRTTGR